MKKAVIYTRVSSEEQVKGNSLSEQERKCQYFIKSKDGDITDTYIDGGKGGETKERPELQRMLEDAKKGIFDAVVVYKIDRLSRSLKDFLDMQDYLTKLNVELISVSEAYDTSTPQGRLFIHMLSSFAEFEREQIKERINMGQIASMKKGNWKGSPPYGYDLKDKKLVINKKEAKVVKNIFKLFADNCYEIERLTLMKAQKIVNTWNVPTKLAKNRTYKKSSPNFWNTSTVQNVIKKEIYTGKTHIRKMTKNTNPSIKNKRVLRPREEWIEYKAPKIISRETFDKAQIVLKKNSEFAFRKQKFPDGILSKIVYCSECGRKYAVCHEKGKAEKYQCYCQGTKKFRTDERCTAKSFVSYRLEEPLWDKLKKILSNPEILQKHIDKQVNNINKKDTQENIKQLDRDLQKIKNQRKRLLNLYLVGDIERDNFKERDNWLEKEETTSAIKINEINQSKILSEEMKSKSLNFDALYKKLNINLNNIDYENKVKVVKLLINKIETNGQGFAKVHCLLPQSLGLKTDQRVCF
jgi:site-specific DNA recombinase